MCLVYIQCIYDENFNDLSCEVFRNVTWHPFSTAVAFEREQHIGNLKHSLRTAIVLFPKFGRLLSIQLQELRTPRTRGLLGLLKNRPGKFVASSVTQRCIARFCLNLEGCCTMGLVMKAENDWRKATASGRTALIAIIS